MELLVSPEYSLLIKLVSLSPANSQKWGKKALTVTWEVFHNANSQFLTAKVKYQPIRSHLLETTSTLKYLL